MEEESQQIQKEGQNNSDILGPESPACTAGEDENASLRLPRTTQTGNLHCE